MKFTVKIWVLVMRCRWSELWVFVLIGVWYIVKVHRTVTVIVLLKVTLKVTLKVIVKVVKVTLKVCLFFLFSSLLFEPGFTELIRLNQDSQDFTDLQDQTVKRQSQEILSA